MALLEILFLMGLMTFSKATVPEKDFAKFVDIEEATNLARNTDLNFRLPRNIIPIHYDVNLTPRFTGDQNFTFTGRVVIIIQATENDVNTIKLHAANITGYTAELIATGSTTSPNLVNGAIGLDTTYDFMTIPLLIPLTVGSNYTLTINYEGLIQGGNLMRGFYRSWYLDVNNTISWMGTTQFQPGHACRAFPCWDEPSFKAVFVITINRLPSYEPSISNMPIESSDPINNGELIADTFYPTPEMSTYLIAFIVSGYVAHNETVAADTSRPFAVYGRESATPQGQYAFDVGIALLERMENITDYSYYGMGENMKMDQAGIPDFSAGAMENWGLLTYREALIFYDETQTSNFYQQRIANIIAHEIAHMWFGNLVTCDWWDNLWLNEGFARYYQYFLTNLVEPGMEFDITYVVDQVRDALFADSLASAHAMTNPNTNSPTEVSATFSTISYAKASAIIRMMEHLLSEDTFNKGLRAYLRSKAYSTALPSDLYQAWQEAAEEDGAMTKYGVSVAQVMNSWVSKSGYPVINVVVNQTSRLMTVSQQRFFRSADTAATGDIYLVPFTFTTQHLPDWDNTAVDYILTVSQSTYPIGTDEEGWVIFNKKGTGFYRVNYDSDTWERIIATLNDNSTISQIDPLNRALICDDIFQFARAGALDYVTMFRYLTWLRHETSYPVWNNALSGFAFLQRRLAHEEVALKLLENFMLTSMERVITDLTFTEATTDSHLRKMLREKIMLVACDLGHEDCINFAMETFAAFTRTNNPVEVPPNLRIWVYCTALRNGVSEDFDFLWDRRLSSKVYNEKIEILGILGCSTNENQLKSYLTEIFSDDTESEIRAQDVLAALSSVLTGNENNTDVVFDWIKENYQLVEEYYSSLSGVATVVNNLAARLIYESQIVELENWVAVTTDLLPISPSLNAAAASARANLQWTETRLQGLVTALGGSESSAAGLTVSLALVSFSVIFTLLL